MKLVLVGVGGFIGANARFWLGALMGDRLSVDFPWSTMIINVSGSLLIGLFLELGGDLVWNPNWRLFAAIGVLGGYTTFSTFSYEAVRLLADRRYGPALVYIEGSALLSVLGAWAGMVLARALLGGKV